MTNNKPLAKCDMVLSLSENMINYQFEQLYKREIIHKNLNIVIFENKEKRKEVKVNQSQENFKKDIEGEKFSYAFNANISVPTISILKDESKVMSLYIPFDSGTMYYWRLIEMKPQLEQADMSNWKYAFKVQIGSIEKDVKDLKWVTPDSRGYFEKICKEIGLPQEIFTMESLFLDFENTNFADYDEKKSNVPTDITELAIFQNILNNYFKTIVSKEENPYILGYGMKLKKIEDQKEALFQPTALKYSTTYDEDVNKRSFNFLMMTDKKDFPDDQDVGVLPRTLIQAGDNDGILAIDSTLFCQNVFKQINFESIISKALSKVAEDKEVQMRKNESSWFQGQRADVDKPLYLEGKMTISTYYYTANDNPYALTVSGGSMTVNLGNWISRSFTDKTVVIPVLKFFSNRFVIMEGKINAKVPYKSGDKVETKDFPFTMASFSKETSYPLGIGIAIYIDTKQQMTVSGSNMQSITKDGYARTTSPSYVLYNVKADGNGKVSFEHTEEGFSIDSKKIDKDGGTGLNSSFNIFHHTLEKQIKSSLDEITNAMQKLCTSKVILPLGKVYSFKDIRFKDDPGIVPMDENYVAVNVNYAAS